MAAPTAIDTISSVRHSSELHSGSTLTCCKLSKPTISPVVEQVFNTTELLECILLHFGNLERTSWTRLFPAQRVSRRFRDVIHASPALRRRMFLESPKPALLASTLPAILDGYRSFFGVVSPVLQPFFCHIRPSGVEGELILAMNVSLSWREETPGVMVGRAPETLQSAHASAQNMSWRRLRIPYSPAQDLDMHCCGYPLEDRLKNGITLGELADKAIAAGKGHFGAFEPVRYHVS